MTEATEEKKVRKNILFEGTRAEKITFLDKRISRDFADADKIKLISSLKEAIALPNDDSKFDSLVKTLKKAPNIVPILDILTDIYTEDAQTVQAELPIGYRAEPEDDDSEDDNE